MENSPNRLSEEEIQRFLSKYIIEFHNLDPLSKDRRITGESNLEESLTKVLPVSEALRYDEIQDKTLENMSKKIERLYHMRLDRAHNIQNGCSATLSALRQLELVSPENESTLLNYVSCHAKRYERAAKAGLAIKKYNLGLSVNRNSLNRNLPYLGLVKQETLYTEPISE
jgi:hypothetical protein